MMIKTGWVAAIKPPPINEGGGGAQPVLSRKKKNIIHNITGGANMEIKKNTLPVKPTNHGPLKPIIVKADEH